MKSASSAKENVQYISRHVNDYNGQRAMYLVLGFFSFADMTIYYIQQFLHQKNGGVLKRSFRKFNWFVSSVN